MCRKRQNDKSREIGGVSPLPLCPIRLEGPTENVLKAKSLKLKITAFSCYFP